ncbi:hypothetical protein BU14_0033s0046 [Porphyra umbilicalis]|uniref:Uncharacterized protein n=1 Tax=Porphyra umbilicalis TaxID=2786 RepID=A0A1X6PIL1_PORUM|nr:hypothetical protein BU14_0033s0046 [Porphyra umbilicalis]|eukprot:OSX80702.1 hypothetical protein BU14_0033s0046 [Porphyra umbilicalis]
MAGCKLRVCPSPSRWWPLPNLSRVPCRTAVGVAMPRSVILRVTWAPPKSTATCPPPALSWKTRRAARS